MGSQIFFKVKLVESVVTQMRTLDGARVIAASLSILVGSLGIAEAAVRASGWSQGPKAAPVRLTAAPALPVHLIEEPPQPRFEGRDIDGDGAPDFANPTGGDPRGHDRFGDGYFHASRSGGAREHEGVDYDSRAGQQVVAPISGYVARIGLAYPDDARLKYVEIDNPALHLQARVFYVEPEVQVGQTVELGGSIGEALSLQARYAGITNHVHLEIEEAGRKIDAQKVILARGGPAASVMAGMN
jgi:murein DD-endopeptidase MepM/ murein hydrolase activator NlpD